MITSIVQDPEIVYPSGEDCFSPDEAYPEYPYHQLSRRPNGVYRAIRTCLAQAGLDREHFGSPLWNPFRYMIPAGSNVFILCNFVYHRRDRETEQEFFAKCTHGSVLRAVTDYILLAAGREGVVRFGNAPIQSCDWERILVETGASKVAEFYERFTDCRVDPCDLRSHVITVTPYGGIASVTSKPDARDEVQVDIGQESFLEELYGGNRMPRFRSLDYDPLQTDRFHGTRKHVYVLNRTFLEADVVFSVPKLKTHEKVGVTLGLKGCVGAIAHKHCLAHHRMGSPSEGGDEYPDKDFFARIESGFSEYVNRREVSGFSNILRIVDRIYRKVIRSFGSTIAGGWAGNDTAWRMSLDIARIVRYASGTGLLNKEPARPHLLLIDGIIGGEGHGPLSPTPRKAGVLLYSDDVVAGDYVGCCLMGFDPDKLPILRGAFSPREYALTDLQPASIAATWNGRRLGREELRGMVAVPFKTPPKWEGRV